MYEFAICSASANTASDTTTFRLTRKSKAFRSPSSAAVVSRRPRRLARTASIEKRRPSGRNAVHSASSPSIQSPPFSSSVTRPCRLRTQINAITCMSRVRQPTSSSR
jgi:hypothetical protein